MKHVPRLCGAFALAASCISAAAAAPAPEPKDPGRIPSIPGGAADADGAKGFVANDKGGVYQVVTLPPAGLTLVHEVPAGGPDDAAWTAYALATGKQAARFNAEPGVVQFSAIGPRAYYVVRGPTKGPPFGGVVPRTLKAVDLTTGKHLWEQPLEGERLPPPFPK